MLQLKNITKIYRSKAGETKALDDLSVEFGETGMIFILGKSGSGKSTLLNVCGGLDNPDSGEIVIKGRSSKDFSQTDFDSYRNTCVGFIFQEYNILNEFSVEDNIALALELQGKPKDKAEIEKILEEVELTNFAKRKPNTLSGGQKQRVAIARALVKNPEIIMADEPTGALDSNTGKQVFETLKKLSEKKLVIVISHDRDFAETYGDRIIELKDGKIISDVTKTKIESEKQGENFSIIGNDTIIVKEGSKLNKADFDKINAFISEAKGDILLSKNEKGIGNYKAFSKICDDNSQEVFEETKSQPEMKTYSDEESKFIRSRLPLRHAVKIGASGLKIKPVRLIFTILLTIISFVMFGLFSTVMFFNENNIAAESLVASDVNYLKLGNSYYYKAVYYSGDYKYESDNYQETVFTQDDIELLKQQFGNDILVTYPLNQAEIKNTEPEKYTDYAKISTFLYADANLEYTGGRAPESENEIAISEYTFDVIKRGVYRDPNTNIQKTINDYEDIKIKFDDSAVFQVCGVFRTDEIQNVSENQNVSYGESLYTDDILTAGVITDESYKKLKTIIPLNFNLISSSVEMYDLFMKTSYSDENFIYVNKISDSISSSDKIIGRDGSENISLTSNYVILNIVDWYTNIFDYICMPKINENGNLSKLFYEDVDENNLSLDSKTQILNGYVYGGQGSENIAIEYFKELLAFIDQNGICDFTLSLGNSNGTMVSGLNIAGISFNTKDQNARLIIDEVNYKKVLDFSKNSSGYDEYITDYVYSASDYYSVIVPTNADASIIKEILNSSLTVNDNGTKLQVKNSVLSSVTMMTSMISILSDVFLWVGVVLAVFSMLLLFNFISVSISNKKREIGILRAVGARGSDVFKIFFSESFIIVLICSVLSIISTFIACMLINDAIAKEYTVPIQLFSFGFIPVVMILGIAIVTSFISTFLPVFLFSRKKPVDTIKSL